MEDKVLLYQLQLNSSTKLPSVVCFLRQNYNSKIVSLKSSICDILGAHIINIVLVKLFKISQNLDVNKLYDYNVSMS